MPPLTLGSFLRRSVLFVGQGATGASAPTLASVSTSGGAVGDKDGGYTATLTGTSYTGATGVTFGGTAATSVVVVNATTITCTVPAHSSGFVSVVVTTPSGTNGANTAFRYASIQDQLATGIWRGSYSGSPWAATSCAGTSATNGSLTEATSPPTTGSAINGFVPAAFDGSTTRIGSATVSTGTFLSATAWSASVLFYATTAGTSSPGNAYLEPALVTDMSNGFFYVTHSTRGVTAGHYDGVSFKEVTLACGIGAWHYAQAWFDGTNLHLQVDSTVATPVAAGNNSSSTLLRVGANYNASVFFNGRIEEIIVANIDMGVAPRADLKSCVNTKYNLAL